MSWDRLKSWAYRDAYSGAGLLIFASMVALLWKPYVGKHEGIYLLGSRRVLDPEFLAADLTWSVLPPTTFLYDHLMALFGSVVSEFPLIVLGRLLTWALLAGALAMFARQLRLPAWSIVVGTALFLLWGQTLFSCGRMLEGFQPKSFAYPLTFLALTFLLRGQAVRAGVASGVATSFHIIDGGWACLAIFLAMSMNPRQFPRRQLGLFLLATTPFIAPLVLAVGFFHVGGVAPEARALMDEIYVTFAQPHCCDPDFFMSGPRWFDVLTVFPVSVGLLLLWPERRGGRFVGCFLAVVVGVFGAGLLASELEIRSFQKLYPYQLSASYPVLLLFVLSLAFCGVDGARSPLLRALWIAGIVLSLGLLDDKDATDEIRDLPGRLATARPADPPSRYGRRVSNRKLEVYDWIRENTPTDSVFATPNLSEFWIYAERAQVASFRHPPHDQKLIEWKQRLEGLNGFRPFKSRGFDIRDELDAHQPDLDAADMIQLRDRYGATHALIQGAADPDLEGQVVFDSGSWVVVRLAGL